MIAHAAAYDANVVLIEDASSGAGLIQDLSYEGRIHPIAMRPEGDKVIRLEKRSAVIEAGQVRLPESLLGLAILSTRSLLSRMGISMIKWTVCRNF